MHEMTEKIVEVGFRRKPSDIFDEVEQVTARMVREGWTLTETCLEDGLGNVHLIFQREIGEHS